MLIDLNLLRIVKYRKDFFMLRGRVPKAAMDKYTNVLLDDYQAYFDQFPMHDKIDYATFLPIFRSKHPTLSDEQKNTFETVLKNAMTADVDDDAREGILYNMLELRMGTDVANLLARYEAGDIENIRAELEQCIAEFKADAQVTGIQWVTDDIGDLLAEEASDHGLRWRLDCLNDSMRGLRPGDFGIYAARPDRGKTTGMLSEITHLASQLPPDQPCLWFNNEGPGKRIIPRMYQAALGMKVSEMITLHNTGALKPAYEEVMGSMDKIKIIDIHNKDNYSVESIIEQLKPGLVVFDMIDNIRGFGDAARTDLGLERMYQWAREAGVQYEFAGMAASQISADGEGLQFPRQDMLKDSKTGKQGACDYIITLGASNDPGLANQRFIGLTKNKLRREGKPADPRQPVKFSPHIARIEEIPVLQEASTEKEQ